MILYKRIIIRVAVIINLLMLSPFIMISQVLIKPNSDNIQNYIDWKKISEQHENEGLEAYECIHIDLNILNSYKTIEANCFGSKIVVTENNCLVRGIKNYTWFGCNERRDCTISICVTGKNVQGYLTKNSELYRIETIDEKYFLFKINRSKLGKKTCGVVNTSDKEVPVINNKNNVNYKLFQKSTTNYSCKIRVLVMYTPNAQANVSNIHSLAQLSVDQMNQSFLNSNIAAEIELVHVHLTNYTETDIVPTGSATHDNDLTRFTTDGDGYMDEVHNLRREFSADVCVLICDIPNSLGYAGIARSIKSSATNSFCLVDYWYSYMNMTFAHEIGHLIGCRHDENSDPSSVPYTYGHGYSVNDPANGSWRTIMGTFNSCNGCQRQLLWSNPQISTSLGAAGTYSTNDNARVIEENYENFKSHRPSDGVSIVNQSMVNAYIGNSVYNANVIETNGGVIIDSNKTFSLYAGNNIVIKPGFSAFHGSEFQANIVSPCGVPDGLPDDYELTADSLTDNKIGIATFQSESSINIGTEVLSLKLLPNPVVDDLTVVLELSGFSSEIKIEIVNYNGNIVQTIFEGNKMDGIHKLKTSVSSYEAGIYFIVVMTGKNEIINKKFVKV